MSKLEGNQDRYPDKHPDRTPQTRPVTFNARPETLESLQRLARQLNTDLDGALEHLSKQVEPEKTGYVYIPWKPDEEPPPDGNEE